MWRWEGEECVDGQQEGEREGGGVCIRMKVDEWEGVWTGRTGRWAVERREGGCVDGQKGGREGGCVDGQEGGREEGGRERSV